MKMCISCAGMREVWEEGQAAHQLQHRLAAIAAAREEIEAARKVSFGVQNTSTDHPH